jgi:hypothetical protein
LGISEITFIQNKKSWGYPFRFGLLEIPEVDFQKIAEAMRAQILVSI